MAISSPIPFTTNSHGYMDPYSSFPSERVFYYPTETDAATTLTSEKDSDSWASINEEAHYLPGMAHFPGIHSRDIQAYPPPPYPPMPPNHGINDESETLVPEKLITSVPDAGLPLIYPSNTTPPKSTVHLPASGISIGDFSSNTHAFTLVDTASDFTVPPILPGTSDIPPPDEGREKREPQDRPHQYRKSRKKGEVESLHQSGDSLTFVKLIFLDLDSRAMTATQRMHRDKDLIDINKRSTNPVCACIAVPSGVDLMHIGITLKSTIPVPTVIWYWGRLRGRVADLQVSQNSRHNRFRFPPLITVDGVILEPQGIHLQL
jgi:hypothetical protein